MYTTLQNTPITIDLTQQGNSTGWTVNGTNAIHETCNAGSISLINYPITVGLTYEISYRVNSINSGNVQLSLGGINSLARTNTGDYTDTITSINTNPLAFFSNANANISLVNVRISTVVFNPKSTETITWSEENNKWSSWRGYNPDFGISLFANMFTYKNGALYRHALTNTRNNFYGVQYPSILRFVGNVLQGQPKTFESLSYESNRLLITTTDGITTSLGQLSELISDDFLHEVLDDGVTQINIYNVEGVYAAGFLRNKSENILTGADLKGTYITIELTTTDVGVLKLRNVLVNSVPSRIGSR